MAADDGLSGVLTLCEDADCGSALLLDARDPGRLHMWLAGCPDGPSAMFRVANVHTVAELKLDQDSESFAIPGSLLNSLAASADFYIIFSILIWFW